MANSRNSPPIESAAQFSAVVAAVLERHVQPGARLAVGFSGGVDSVVLLHVLATLRQSAIPVPFSLAAVHVDHGLSPHASTWATDAMQTASRLGVPCRIAKVTVERGSRDGLEGAARRARHAALAQSDADWIVLAHQQDDQAETLLFNLLRGCGLAGAAAMRERNGRLLRPLLGVGREAIERYARLQGLTWIEDESNADLRHTRNFLRHRVLAPLRERFPAAPRVLAAATGHFAEALELLDALARCDLGEIDDFPLPVERLRGVAEARARNLLRYLLARHEVPIPTAARLREAVRQLTGAAVDRHPAVGFGAFRLVRRRDSVYLEADDPARR